jgi:hypothetical protein
VKFVQLVDLTVDARSGEKAMYKLRGGQMFIPEHSSRARKSSLIAENDKKKRV